jgi:hypothetical protein
MVRVHNAENPLLKLTYGDKVPRVLQRSFLRLHIDRRFNTSNLYIPPSHIADTGSVDRQLQRENHASSVYPVNGSEPR